MWDLSGPVCPELCVLEGVLEGSGFRGYGVYKVHKGL